MVQIIKTPLTFVVLALIKPGRAIPLLNYLLVTLTGGRVSGFFIYKLQMIFHSRQFEVKGCELGLDASLIHLIFNCLDRNKDSVKSVSKMCH